MVAERLGRRLEYGVRQAGNFWRHPKTYPSFSVEYRGGAFQVDPSAPLRVQNIFQQMPPGRIWRKLKIYSGPQGLKTERPVRLAKYFLHDLWLMEKILSVLPG